MATLIGLTGTFDGWPAKRAVASPADKAAAGRLAAALEGFRFRAKVAFKRGPERDGRVKAIDIGPRFVPFFARIARAPWPFGVRLFIQPFGFP